MIQADWRDPDAYKGCQSLDAPGFAWEYLRRNADFLRQRRKLERDAVRGSLDADKVQAFTRQWGVCFQAADPGAGSEPVVWAPHALPSIVTLTALPPDPAAPSFALAPVAAERLGELLGVSSFPADHPDPTIRMHVTPEGAHPAAALLPFDQLFEQRAQAAIRAWRAVTGRSPGPNPASLPKQRRDRLVLALRAIDGRVAKASYRDLAGELFGALDVSSQAWKTHDLRDRTIRLVRFGVAMTQGGYRRLLLHPYRRRS